MRELYQVSTKRLEATQTERIKKLALAQPTETGRIFSSDETMAGLRTCTVRWVRDAWLEDLLWTHVNQANLNGFGVNVQKRSEMQVIAYQAQDRGHYDWHHDVQWYGQSEFDRKISVTVQLSDADDYQGGDFEFEEVCTNVNFRPKGTVLMFPSYLRHKVHAVTRGTRYALVAWFYGPRWQ